MPFLTAHELRKEWNGSLLFEKVTFDGAKGQRIAPFGRNGTGKTTLPKGALGQLLFDGEEVPRYLPLAERGWTDRQAGMEAGPQTVRGVCPVGRCGVSSGLHLDGYGWKAKVRLFEGTYAEYERRSATTKCRRENKPAKTK